MATKKKDKDKDKAEKKPIVVYDVQAFVENLKRVSDQIRTKELPFTITGAKIKDDFCNYDFDITQGVGAGDSHKVNGRGIIHDDMRESVAKLNIHLALIDDAFGEREITDLNELTGDVITRYHVTGFEFKGLAGAESVVLIGNKYVHSTRGRIELKTPPVSLEDLSGYKWHEELNKVATDARNEVAMYKEGKYTPVHDTKVKDDKQLSLLDTQDEDTGEFEDELESARA